MKHTCFIDTCSYVNLAHEDCYVNGQTLLTLLNKEVTLKITNEVNREISRHYTPLMPTSIKRSAQLYKLKHRRIKTYKEYESRIFKNISKQGDKNRGEKHNFIAALDNYISDKKIGLIYLTDDNNALRGVLKECIHSFPIYNIWNSYDVIVFLYINNKYFVRDFAEAAIKNITAEMAKSHTPQTSPEKTEQRIKTYKLYMDKIRFVAKVLKK